MTLIPKGGRSPGCFQWILKAHQSKDTLSHQSEDILEKNIIETKDPSAELLHLMCFLLLFEKNWLKEKAFPVLGLLCIFLNQNLIKMKHLINNEELLSNNVVKILSSLNNNEEISAGRRSI